MTPNQRRKVEADAEAALQRAPITDRVNVEPAILNGMTVTEAKVIGAVALVVCLVAGGVVSAVTGYWQVMLMLAVFGPLVVLWAASLYLARIKRGRPDGYYTQAIHLWLAERSLARAKFITYHGFWGLGRTLDLALVSRLNPPVEAHRKSPTHPSKP